MVLRLAPLLIAALALHTWPACAQSLPNAFNEGAALGRSGNAAARGQITGGAAQATVPHFTTAPPEAAYFGSLGLGTPSSARVGACAGAGGASGNFSGQGCAAIDFSQINLPRRPTYSITSGDPLLSRARTITANPQAIAGALAGTYTGCSVQTVRRPDIFETLICHQYPSIENATCDKVLIVTPIKTPGCAPGQFLTRVTADPCPACIDYLAYDFSCGVNNYLMHVFTIYKASGGVHLELGSQYVPGTLNTEVGVTQGPSQIDGYFCYQTYYNQSCSGANCSIGAWFYNPCQGTSYVGVNTFRIPTTVSFTDTWDNQCAALEARAQ